MGKQVLLTPRPRAYLVPKLRDVRSAVLSGRNGLSGASDVTFVRLDIHQRRLASAYPPEGASHSAHKPNNERDDDNCSEDAADIHMNLLSGP
jgi:hypothetical protein